ncbi:PHP domain-containing protein [Peribacillus simplex]|uniref:PHP domain-containing protein n=1 Tax=Peribacillus simplex TaxID=1478 RepID=UPI0021AA0CAD|nr:PHP domain-containing protein [Peribacillus simplex]
MSSFLRREEDKGIDIQGIVKAGSFDLHLHTTASDGEYSPREIVQKAYQKGLKTIAITDHDTLDGIEEAVKAGNEYGIQVISGIELSTKYKGKSVDILGYGIKATKELTKVLKKIRNERETRALSIIQKFRDIDMPISMDDVLKYSQGEVISRPHIAKAIIAAGYSSDYQEVFDMYLADGKPCAVDKMTLTPEEGIGLIHDAGGLAVLAHPIFLRDHLVLKLLKFPFDGIEVWHRKHAKEDSQRYKEYANDHQLFMTGGSDFHTEDYPLGEFGYDVSV